MLALADEVIISEYTDPLGSAVGTIYGRPITSQVLDIATLSSEVSSSTVMIRLQSKDVGFWYKQGDSSVSAAANTNGSHWLPADQHIDLSVSEDRRYIDTAAAT